MYVDTDRKELNFFLILLSFYVLVIAYTNLHDIFLFPSISSNLDLSKFH